MKPETSEWAVPVVVTIVVFVWIVLMIVIGAGGRV
jgi:hypothetical protein